MVPGKEKDMKKTIIFAIPILLVGMLVMGFAGYQLYETKQVYQEADTTYEKLSDRVKRNTAVDLPKPQTQEDAVNEVIPPREDEIRTYIPAFEIDFDLLEEINEDSVAWLFSPDTVIDYPIMKADDYVYYLNHLSDGTVNANGSLFIDYNNASDFSDELTVIYGHHMKSGSMFGSLVEYKGQEYYEKHPYMYLYTEKENYRIDLMYGSVIGAGQWRKNAFMYQENLEALLAYAMNNTTFVSDIDYQDGDKIVVLSTCSYEFDDARYFVVGRLT